MKKQQDELRECKRVPTGKMIHYIIWELKLKNSKGNVRGTAGGEMKEQCDPKGNGSAPEKKLLGKLENLQQYIFS